MKHSMWTFNLLREDSEPVHEKTPKLQLRRRRSERWQSRFLFTQNVVNFQYELRFPPLIFHHHPFGNASKKAVSAIWSLYFTLKALLKRRTFRQKHEGKVDQASSSSLLDLDAMREIWVSREISKYPNLEKRRPIREVLVTKSSL